MAAQEVTTYNLASIRICTEVMPIGFRQVAEILRRAMDLHTSNPIIMLGQPGGNDRIKLERTATSLVGPKLPDNGGYLPNEETVYIDGTLVLFTNTSVRELHTTIEQLEIRVKTSNSSGLHVYDRLYYEALLIT